MDFDQRDRRRVGQRPRQKVLNEFWSLRDSKGEPHARGIPDQPNPIPVRARVEWEGDGEEWLDGIACRWTARAVFVTLDDERLRPNGVWLSPADLRQPSEHFGWSARALVAGARP